MKNSAPSIAAALSVSGFFCFCAVSIAVAEKPAPALPSTPVVTIPDWEQTPDAVEAAMNMAINRANAALDAVGRQDLKSVTFKSTVVALDDLGYEANLAASKAVVIKQTSTNPAMRTAAEKAVK